MNFYQLKVCEHYQVVSFTYAEVKDTLMAHVDRSEVCATSPLVSISCVAVLSLGSHSEDLCRLGNAAVFLIGGLTRDTEPTPILLRSGDVVIMSGPACRRAYHGKYFGISLIVLGIYSRTCRCSEDT